jgi:hypothetical protein
MRRDLAMAGYDRNHSVGRQKYRYTRSSSNSAALSDGVSKDFHGWGRRSRDGGLYCIAERFLSSRVGRPWNDVWSEICSSDRSKRGLALRRAIRWVVFLDYRLDESGRSYRIGYGGPCYASASGRSRRDLAVCPATGRLLKERDLPGARETALEQEAERKAQRARRDEAERNRQGGYRVVPTSLRPGSSMVDDGGRWWMVTVSRVPSPSWKQADVLIGDADAERWVVAAGGRRIESLGGNAWAAMVETGAGAVCMVGSGAPGTVPAKRSPLKGVYRLPAGRYCSAVRRATADEVSAAGKHDGRMTAGD